MSSRLTHKLNPKHRALSLRKKDGFTFEDKVSKILEAKGWIHLSQNVKISGVEVDLLFEDEFQQKIILVEVKYRSRSQHWGSLISLSQHRRLMGVLVKLRKFYPLRQVSWMLAYRNPQGEVEFVANPCYF